MKIISPTYSLQQGVDTKILSDFLLENVLFFIGAFEVEGDKVIFRTFERDSVVDDFVKFYLADNKDQVLQLLGRENLIIEVDTLDIFLYKPDVQYVQYTQADIIGVDFASLVKSFIKGYLMCKKLDFHISKNLLFIEHVYVKPYHFEDILMKIKDYSLSFLVGDPKSGKTYSVYYIIYHLFYEENYRIFNCIGLKQFRKLVSDANLYYKNDKVVIYYEDPFGFSTLETEQVNEIFSELTNVRFSNIIVLITSRIQIFLSAIQATGALELVNSEVVIDYRFLQTDIAPSDNFKNTINVNYDERKIKEIILRIGWLYNSKWITKFAKYLKKPEIGWIWDTLEYDKFSPGNIYESFLICKSLKDFDIDEFDKIKRCLLSGSLDLIQAFNSEVNIFVKREKKFYVKLFFVLPAITVLEDNRQIEEIFGDEYEEVKNYLDILKYNTKSAFTKRSLTYYHPLFGEAIDQYLFKYGFDEFIYDDDLIKFIGTRNNFPENFIVDFVCFYYYLYFTKHINRGSGRVNTNIRTEFLLSINKQIHKIQNEKIEKQVQIIGFFYDSILSKKPNDKTKGEHIEEFIEKLVQKSDLSFASYVASILEHQIYLRVKYFQQGDFPQTVSLIIKAVSNLVRGNQFDTKADVISSVFIHSIFSSLEELISYDSDIQENEVFGSLSDAIRSVYTHYNVISNSRKTQFYLNISIIWIDAIIMKFTELHQYSCENKGIVRRLKELSENSSDYVQQQNIELLEKDVQHCAAVRDALFKLFTELWRKIKKQKDSSYLKGAISFSLVWHNRWKFGEGYLAFVNWLEKEGLTTPTSYNSDSDFQEGFIYNVTYHYNYFMTRNDAWTRESSIMIWRIGSPRKGANALYESGVLNYDNAVEKKSGTVKNVVAAVDEIVLLDEMLKKLFDGLSDGESYLKLRAMLYLVGIRYEKNSSNYHELVDKIDLNVTSKRSMQLEAMLADVVVDLKACQFTLFADKIDSWIARF